ncbi:MAG: hypothetical protein JWR75_1177 [Devosia sp.]|nr:hypothetical protein [Devosia sp.]
MTVKSRQPRLPEADFEAVPAWMADAISRARPQPQQQIPLYAERPRAPRYEDELAAEESGDKAWVYHF